MWRLSHNRVLRMRPPHSRRHEAPIHITCTISQFLAFFYSFCSLPKKIGWSSRDGRQRGLSESDLPAPLLPRPPPGKNLLSFFGSACGVMLGIRSIEDFGRNRCCWACHQSGETIVEVDFSPRIYRRPNYMEMLTLTKPYLSISALLLPL